MTYTRTDYLCDTTAQGVCWIGGREHRVEDCDAYHERLGHEDEPDPELSCEFRAN
jgi:hypothetical protein